MTLTPEEQFWNEVRCGLKMMVAAIEKRYPALAASRVAAAPRRSEPGVTRPERPAVPGSQNIFD
jgi:hypothetical protein